MLPSCIGWLADPAPERGVYLADDADGWEFRAYGEIVGAARRTASAMLADGVRRGDVVCVVLPTDYTCLSVLFGVWVAGATICPIAPPMLQSEEEYVVHLAALLREARPALTATCEELGPLVDRAARLADVPRSTWIAREGPDEAALQPRGETALLQFTSGSTAHPRGVRVSWSNIDANLTVIRRWLAWRDGDGMASWLPLYHDMGLIGALLFMSATQGNLWLMRPEQFIQNPVRWLGCFRPGGASISASPSFPFGFIARRVRPEALRGLDLSEWRCAVVGAETLDPVAMDAFATLTEPCGFSPRTFVPAYGLAENTLGVTSPGWGSAPRIVRPSWNHMRFGHAVRIEENARLGQVTPRPGAGWLVGHGRPVEADDIVVWITDAGGRPLRDGYLGEIVIVGASVAQGYHRGRRGGGTRFVDGALHTGDAGFYHDGELFVLGRMGESLKVRGRSVYVEDLDAKVAAATGLGRGRIAVVSTTSTARPGIAVFVEAEPGAWVAQAVSALRGELGPDPQIRLIAGGRGLVRRTSSGKPRRHHMWQLLQAGQMGNVTVIGDEFPRSPLGPPVRLEGGHLERK